MARRLNEQRFCSWCGHKVTWKTDYMSECQQCGFRNYLNLRPTTNIIVGHNGKVLLGERAIEPGKGKFDLPGGFIDMSDTSIEVAALRELNEEFGIAPDAVQNLQYLGSFNVNEYVWMDTEVPNMALYFACELLANPHNIQIDPAEITSLRWVGKESLDGIDFAWPTDKPMLEKYFKEI